MKNKKVAQFKNKTPVRKVLIVKPDLSAVEGHPHYDLFNMLTYMRPHESIHETLFIQEFIAPLNPSSDEFGNMWLDVGDNPKVMFSSHVDTVHMESGFQTFTYNQEEEVIYADEGDCLGTDDATGIYIMLKMIAAGVRGRYVFHRGEEVGCLGSQWIVDNKPVWLEEMEVAVAFDRMGTTDIITHQSTGKCASDDFALDLADRFAELGLHEFSPSPHGIYTDTAHYNGYIQECINLSVGYYEQHGDREHQDLDFLTKLVDACIKLDWHSVAVERKVTDFGEDLIFDSYFGVGGSSVSESTLITALKHCPEGAAQVLLDQFVVTQQDIDEMYDAQVDYDLMLESMGFDSDQEQAI